MTSNDLDDQKNLEIIPFSTGRPLAKTTNDSFFEIRLMISTSYGNILSNAFTFTLILWSGIHGRLVGFSVFLKTRPTYRDRGLSGPQGFEGSVKIAFEFTNRSVGQTVHKSLS